MRDTCPPTAHGFRHGTRLRPRGVGIAEIPLTSRRDTIRPGGRRNPCPAVPDEVVRRADQTELVDMTPEALRRRM
ncbi:hypothetical protein ABZ678_31440, partial [Streptomyces hirsutus]|uniref:hypothetical protein n=1 Tax=Streptomyces hirsutus TaxID=35620 RepID=UPI003401E651